MQPPFPAPTAEWHNDTYAAIDPKNAAISAAGKTVIVTGAGAGIGRETALAFAQAGAAAIAVLGRTAKTLEDTKTYIEKSVPGAKVSVQVVDVTSLADAKRAAAAVGAWDVLVLNAGFMSSPGNIDQADVEDWWKGYEINVKGSMVMSQAFLPSRNPHAAILATSTGMVVMPSEMSKGFSSYVSSKLAVVNVFEILAAEFPDVHVLTFHPGIVETAMYTKSGMEGMPTDSPQLPAHFAVWAASPEAAFARGKFVWSNWDVVQLKQRAEELQSGPIFTSTVDGWPFAPAAA